MGGVEEVGWVVWRRLDWWCKGGWMGVWKRLDGGWCEGGWMGGGVREVGWGE